jgi:hypothetical protein
MKDMSTTHKALGSIRRQLSAIVGPKYEGMIDYLRSPDRRDTWGGPFNGQQKRRELFLSLIATCQPAAIIETGTYMGASTEFMAATSRLPIFSVEHDARNFGFAKMRLRKYRNIKLSLGDSREFLMKFIERDASRYVGHPLLFYLDAHWGEELPLSAELNTIVSSLSEAIIMIDDFQVPDDHGYGYDDYGIGRALTKDYIAPHVTQYQLTEFYPTVPSALETGARRGCVVLAHNRSLVDMLSRISFLRK